MAYASAHLARWLAPVVDACMIPLSLSLAGRVLGARGVVVWLAAAWLLLLFAIAWRAVVFLVRLVRKSLRDVAAGQEMVDRADPGAAAARTLLGTFAYRELLKNLVMKDLKLKYRGSVFGFLWSLVNPLLMIVVYSLAFTFILRIRTEGFIFFLLLGVLAWSFFANSASMSTGAIVDGGGLVKSAVFPRAIMPVATVLFNFAQYLLTIVVFLPLMLLAYRVTPAPPMLLFPVFLGLQVAFTVGVGLMLATGTTFFRDIRHILEIALSVMFWTTPIVYQVSSVPGVAKTGILLSPLSPFIVAYQQMFYYRQWPDASLWLLATLYAVTSLAFGLRLFVSFEDRFSEQV
jgi:ABC-type polysaccharide/polyol phosphate export permease